MAYAAATTTTTTKYSNSLRGVACAATAIFALALAADIVATASPFWARSTDSKYVDFHMGLWEVCAEAGDTMSACNKITGDAPFLNASNFRRIRAMRGLSIAASVLCGLGMICSMLAIVRRAPSLTFAMCTIPCSIFACICMIVTLILWDDVYDDGISGIPGLKLSWAFGVAVAGCVLSFFGFMPFVFVMQQSWSRKHYTQYETVGTAQTGPAAFFRMSSP